MSWQAIRRIMPFQLGASTKKKSTLDVEPMTASSAAAENMAKILIIGETGSGKSTFINYLTNHFRDGTYDDPKIAIPTRYYPKITESFGHCENVLDDVTVSKTNACNQYLFGDPRTDKLYLFLDTPGLGDTRGVKQDESNIETILNAINNLQGLTGVIIVVNGSISRVTTNFRSVLLALRGNLPDVVLDHVIVILSHVKRHQSTFDIKKTLKMNGTAVYPYYMQNSAFAQDPKKWVAHEREDIERDWVESMEEIRQMLSTINTFETKSVAAFDDMRTIRNAIKTAMHDARLEITKVQRTHDEILAYEHAVKKFQGEEISYQDYTQEQTITVNELVDAPHHSTICAICNFLCHQNCSLQETEEIGNQIFQQCAAMDRGNNCKQCPQNCSFSQHYHARKTMQASEQKLTTVLHDIKAKFDIATKNKTDFEQKLNSAQGARKLMEQVLRQKIDAVQAQCRELRKVCGGFNLAQELHTLVEQLRVEAQTLTSLEARSQADMVIRELNTFCQNLEAQEQNTTMSKSEMVVVDTGSGSDKTAIKFISNTQSKAQESNARVATVEKLLQDQIKKKKTLALTANSSDSNMYERIGEVYQDELQTQNGTSSSHVQPKQQISKVHQRSPHADAVAYDDHASVTMPPSLSQYGRMYSAESAASTERTPKYELMSIKELVDELHVAVRQNRSKVAVERELRNRAQGITFPMVTTSDRVMFTQYTSKYSRMTPSEISYQYMRLQKHINNRLGNDYTNIEKITTISSELLLESAALYTLFSSKDSATKNRDGGDYQYDDDCSRVSLPASSSTTRSSRDSNFRTGDERYGQRPTYHSNPAQLSNYTNPIDSDYDNPKTRSRVYTQENMHAPPSYDDAIGRQNESLSRTRGRSTAPSSQAQREGEMSNTKPSNRNLSASCNAKSSLDDNHNRYRADSKPDFAIMTTDQLVALYSRARKSEDNIQQVAIYAQLEKRCNGEDYLLMKDPLMQQTLDRYRQLETTTLNDKLDAIKWEIRKLTNGGDATQIKNIPTDLLIKMTAITSILQDQLHQSTYF